MPLESAFRQLYSLCFHPLHKHARRFSVGLSTDILGSLSSIMFSSVLWAILLESSPSTKACTQHSGVISLLVSVGAPYFPLKVKLKRYARKKKTVSAIQNTFSVQTEDILVAKYCQMLANSTYFSYPAPETWGCFKTRGTSSTETLLDLRSTGRNEPNIHSVLCENIFSDINAISPTINHLRIHLEIN